MIYKYGLVELERKDIPERIKYERQNIRINKRTTISIISIMSVYNENSEKENDVYKAHSQNL